MNINKNKKTIETERENSYNFQPFVAKRKIIEEIKEEEFVNCPWMEDVPYRR